MVTGDERREVAERLRCLGAGGYARLYEALGLDIVDVMEDERGVLIVYNRLADLIDPESGQNLDTNRDSVPKESPAVPKAPECDREALLALADEMDAYSVHFSTGLQGCTVQAWAMGIREACGKAGA